MKRLVPLLILAAFLLGISGGGIGRNHVNLQICACPQSCPQFSNYFPFDDLSGKWDTADQPLSPLTHVVFFPEPSRKNLLPWNRLRPISSKYFCWQGLGCGGLPS
jgi:hypothetical protein